MTSFFHSYFPKVGEPPKPTRTMASLSKFIHLTIEADTALFGCHPRSIHSSVIQGPPDKKFVVIVVEDVGNIRITLTCNRVNLTIPKEKLQGDSLKAKRNNAKLLDLFIAKICNCLGNASPDFINGKREAVFVETLINNQETKVKGLSKDQQKDLICQIYGYPQSIREDFTDQQLIEKVKAMKELKREGKLEGIQLEVWRKLGFK